MGNPLTLAMQISADPTPAANNVEALLARIADGMDNLNDKASGTGQRVRRAGEDMEIAC